MSLEDIPEIKGEDIRQLELALDGQPIPDHLVVFIQDPQNPDQYWLRKIQITRSSTQIREGKEIPYADVGTLDLGEINRRPLPASLLDRERAYINQQEQILRTHKNPELRRISAVVGVAEYKGNNPLTVDNLVTLIGFKYHQMRAAYSS